MVRGQNVSLTCCSVMNSSDLSGLLGQTTSLLAKHFSSHFNDVLHVVFMSSALSCLIRLRYCVKHFELLCRCNAPNKTTRLPYPGMTHKSLLDGPSWLFWRNSNWTFFLQESPLFFDFAAIILPLGLYCMLTGYVSSCPQSAVLWLLDQC